MLMFGMYAFLGGVFAFFGFFAYLFQLIGVGHIDLSGGEGVQLDATSGWLLLLLIIATIVLTYIDKKYRSSLPSVLRQIVLLLRWFLTAIFAAALLFAIGSAVYIMVVMSGALSGTSSSNAPAGFQTTSTVPVQNSGVPSATIDLNSLKSRSSNFMVTGTASNVTSVLVEFHGTAAGSYGGGGTYPVINGHWTATLTATGNNGIVVYPGSGPQVLLASGELTHI